jgi:hypothetical protein
MKTVISLRITAAVASLVLLCSCLGEVENYETGSFSSPGVIGYGLPADEPSFYIGVTGVGLGYIVPNQSSITEFEGFKAGDCAMVSFFYDSRNQPKGESVNYTVGQSMKLAHVAQSVIEETATPEDTTGYSILTNDAGLFTSSTDPFYFDGRIFFKAIHNIATTQAVSFTASCDYRTLDANNAYTVYLKAHVAGAEGVAKSTEGMFALDLRSMFNSDTGRDTTYNYGGLKLNMRCVRVNFRFLESVDEDGEAVYKEFYTPSGVTDPQLFYLYQGE